MQELNETDSSQPQTTNEEDAPVSLCDINTTILSFMEMMDTRMSRLEENAYHLHTFAEHTKTTLSHMYTSFQQFVSTNNSTSLPVLPGPEEVSESDITLEFVELPTTKWYTERVYDDFKICAMRNKEIYRDTEGWRVELRLLDGNRNLSEARLGDSNKRTVLLKDGVAVVSGVRFSAVSSKNGKHFNIQAVVQAPVEAASTIPPAYSADIVIVSCRLYHNPKRALKELTPQDSLSKMPGIGRLYAERFASYQPCGVHTIRELASIDSSRRARLDLLNHLRRDKGTMTEPKLEEYIEQAQDICKRDEEVAAMQEFAYPVSAGRSAKRQCQIDHDPFAQALVNSPTTTAEQVDGFLNMSRTEVTELSSAEAMLFHPPPIPDLMGTTPQSLPSAPPAVAALGYPSSNQEGVPFSG